MPSISVDLARPIDTVRELLGRGLQIPDYQRPYKWTIRNVAQLVDDVDTFRGYGRYRIGTIVLHRDEHGALNVVDGQQRFLTFCLIAHALAGNNRVAPPEVGAQAVSEIGLEVSRANLIANYNHLQRTLQRDDIDEWAEFFFDRCEVVVLILEDIDEAFQMFDAQNTRGRALYPTDLLKAFHIREMSAEPGLRLAMVRLWESIPPASINELFSDYLFKIRRWANSRAVPSTGFETEHVEMFKGIRESDSLNAKNRWAMPYLYAKNYTDDFSQENATLIRYGAMKRVDYPFQIDQPILNGETFFTMVDHYYQLGLRCGLFRDPRPDVPELYDELRLTLATLEPYRRRDTHRLVRNLFDCLILYWVDRFDDQDLNRAVDLLRRYAMALRVQQKQVRRVMVDRYALGSPPADNLPAVNLFREIREAMRSRDVLNRTLPPPEPNGYAELREFFPDLDWKLK